VGCRSVWKGDEEGYRTRWKIQHFSGASSLQRVRVHRNDGMGAFLVNENPGMRRWLICTQQVAPGSERVQTRFYASTMKYHPDSKHSFPHCHFHSPWGAEHTCSSSFTTGREGDWARIPALQHPCLRPLFLPPHL
jgi:hypothetical protein